MNSLETARCDTVKRLFAAYVAQHPDTVDPMLTQDFTFSSPRDDHIDRKRYFEHCWPKEKVFRDIHIEHLVADGDDVIVGYRTYPHTDMAERGADAADLVHRLHANAGRRPAAHPTGHLVRLPLLSVPPAQEHRAEPMAGVQAADRAKN